MWPFNKLFKNESMESTDEISEHDIKYIKEKMLRITADGEKPFIEVALGKYSEILPVVDKIESGLGAFDSSPVGSPEMDPRLFQILTSNKAVISRKIHDLCKRMRLPAGNGIDSIIAYYRSSYSAISDTIENSINNYEKIEDYLDTQIIPIFKNVNRVADILESFKKEIENFASKHEKMKSLENVLDDFDHQLSNRDAMANRKLLLEKEISDLENEKSTIETQLNEMAATAEYREFSRLNDEAAGMEQQLEKNRLAFLNYMSALGRPLKKFMKLVDDKDVAFEKGMDLSNFLDNPELTHDNVLLIRAAVEKMGSVMEKLNLKEENRIKSLDRMGEILDGKILDGFYEEQSKIRNQLDGVKSLIVIRRPDKKFGLEEKLGKANSRIGLVKNDLAMVENDADGISRWVEQSKQKLEYELKEIFNEDVRIKS